MSGPRPGCGHRGDADGPAHDYLAASAACWARYGEVPALEYSDRAYRPCHRRRVDAYRGQHSRGPDRRARQSLSLHLAALMLSCEDGVADEHIRAFRGRAATSGDPFPEPEMPPEPHDVRLDPVRAAADAAAHHGAVDAYARAVLAAWAAHHAAFRSLIQAI